jgi:hypothetical protein
LRAITTGTAIHVTNIHSALRIDRDIEKVEKVTINWTAATAE